MSDSKTKIIKLNIGPKPDGSWHMNLINGKWRCADWEREWADKDNSRTKNKAEAEERL